MTENIDWATLRSQLSGYPELTRHGRLIGSADVTGDGDAATRHIEIWRQGRCLRGEVDGALWISQRRRHHMELGTHAPPDRTRGTPVAVPAGTLRYHGDAYGFAHPRENRDWSGEDFTRPVGTIIAERFQGRDCWTVELKAPRRKIGPLRMWIDQEFGYLLGEDNEDPETGVPLDDALFVWDGPTVAPEEVEAAQTADHRALEVSQRAWFRGTSRTGPCGSSPQST